MLSQFFSNWFTSENACAEIPSDPVAFLILWVYICSWVSALENNKFTVCWSQSGTNSPVGWWSEKIAGHSSYKSCFSDSETIDLHTTLTNFCNFFSLSPHSLVPIPQFWSHMWKFMRLFQNIMEIATLIWLTEQLFSVSFSIFYTLKNLLDYQNAQQSF